MLLMGVGLVTAIMFLTSCQQAGASAAAGSTPPNQGPEVGTAVSDSTAVPLPSLTPAPSGIWFEVHSGTFVKTALPGNTTTMPLAANANTIYILVHFPAPIPPDVRPNLRLELVPPQTGSWNVEVRNPPTADTIAFDANGGTVPGEFHTQLTDVPNTPPLTLGVQVTQGAQVKLADDSQTLTMNVGDRFLLNLGEEYNWSFTIDDQTIVSRVPNIMTIRGSQGLFEGHKAGRAILTAQGDPPCRQAQPPCGQPSRVFRLTIVVQGT